MFQEPVRGAGHPLRDPTRQRRGLLVGILTCGVCGSAMYSHGKTDGTFRCTGASQRKCWNRVSCMRERVYPAVLEAVADDVLSRDGVRDAVLTRARELSEKGGSLAAELKRLDKAEKQLAAAVEAGNGAIASLTSRLLQREQELAVVQARREEVREQVSHWGKLPTSATLREQLEAVKARLLGDENRAAVILRQFLDGPIRVIPYLRIDGKRVVPRLELTLSLVGVPHPRWRPIRCPSRSRGSMSRRRCCGRRSWSMRSTSRNSCGTYD